MRRLIPLAADTIYLLSYSVWFGGLLGFWLIARPLSRLPADLVEGWFSLTTAIEWSGALMVLVLFLERRRYLKSKPALVLDGVRQLFVFGALFIAVAAAQTGPHSALSKAVLVMASAVELLLLTCVAILTVWLQSGGAGQQAAQVGGEPPRAARSRHP